MRVAQFRVLVTGFLPFGGSATNPSGDAALAMGALGTILAFGPRLDFAVGSISARVFDVLWSNVPPPDASSEASTSSSSTVSSSSDASGAGDQIEAAIQMLSPDVVVSLGMAAQNFRVERIATDEDSSIPDNQGHAPQSGRREFPDEPLQRSTSLPVARIEAAWRNMGITNVEESENAGRFLCEDVFYRVIRIAQDSLYNSHILRAGFIHVPAPGSTEQATINAAIAAAIRVTLSDILSRPRDESAPAIPARPH